MKKGMDQTKFENEIRKAIYLIADNETQEEIINKLMNKGFAKAVAYDIVEGSC